jgi:hypothetical protein
MNGGEQYESSLPENIMISGIEPRKVRRDAGARMSEDMVQEEGTKPITHKTLVAATI